MKIKYIPLKPVMIFKELIKITPDLIETPIKNDNLRGEFYYRGGK